LASLGCQPGNEPGAKESEYQADQRTGNREPEWNHLS
jgi:hypothetical protein